MIRALGAGVAPLCVLVALSGCGSSSKSSSSTSATATKPASSAPASSAPASIRDVTCQEVKANVRTEHALAHQVRDDIKNITNGTVIASYEFAERHVKEACAEAKPQEKPYLTAVAGIGVSQSVIEALAKYAE
jgi:hypothetical protein